jgi:hypothetical protein
MAQRLHLGASPPPPVTFYWYNWTDGKGVSHLTHCKLSNFELRSLSPPAAPEWANRQAPGTASLITVVQPSGWKGYVLGPNRSEHGGHRRNPPS